MSLLWNFWVEFCLYDVICSCIALILHFHNVSWIIDVCLYVGTLCSIRIGLGWTHDAIFFARHMFMHYSYIHTFFIFIFGTLCWWCFSVCLSLSLSFSLSLSLSLSLSHIACTWHPSPKLLHPGTLFMFGSIMRRPVRTSQRTFPDVVFIRNTMWFYRIFSILFYPLSFTVRDRNLYVRYLWDIPSWSYKSSTPVCMISIPLYLDLLHRFKAYIL